MSFDFIYSRNCLRVVIFYLHRSRSRYRGGGGYRRRRSRRRRSIFGSRRRSVRATLLRLSRRNHAFFQSLSFGKKFVNFCFCLLLRSLINPNGDFYRFLFFFSNKRVNSIRGCFSIRFYRNSSISALAIPAIKLLLDFSNLSFSFANKVDCNVMRNCPRLLCFLDCRDKAFNLPNRFHGSLSAISGHFKLITTIRHLTQLLKSAKNRCKCFFIPRIEETFKSQRFQISICKFQLLKLFFQRVDFVLSFCGFRGKLQSFSRSLRFFISFSCFIDSINISLSRLAGIKFTQKLLIFSLLLSGLIHCLFISKNLLGSRTQAGDVNFPSVIAQSREEISSRFLAHSKRSGKVFNVVTSYSKVFVTLLGHQPSFYKRVNTPAHTLGAFSEILLYIFKPSFNLGSGHVDPVFTKDQLSGSLIFASTNLTSLKARLNLLNCSAQRIKDITIFGSILSIKPFLICAGSISKSRSKNFKVFDFRKNARLIALKS